MMDEFNIETLRDYLLAKPAVTEGLPFGPTTLVFKAAGKMFALVSLDTDDLRVNLKCDPERSEQLRERYSSVRPGYHMNKKHWNTLYLDEGELARPQVQELVDHSYDLVVSSLTKKARAAAGL